MEPIRRRLAQFAAIELLLAMLNGMMVGLSLMGVFDADDRILLGAHVATITGALLMLGFGSTVELMRTSPKLTSLGANALIVATLGNWSITTFKAFWRVRGVQFNGETRNDTIVVLLTIFVVIPTFTSGAIWVYGLFKKA